MWMTPVVPWDCRGSVDIGGGCYLPCSSERKGMRNDPPPCYLRPVDELPALTRRSPWMWIAGSILSCLLAVALGSRFRPSKCWQSRDWRAGRTRPEVLPASYGLEDACPQRTTATGGQCDAGNQRAHGTMVLMADDHRSNGHTRGIDNFVCDETSAIGAGERLRIRHGDRLALTLWTQVVRRQSVAPVRIVRSTTASAPIASPFPYVSAGRLAPRPASGIDRAYGGDLQVLYAARGAPIILLTANHILSPRVGFPRTKNVGGPTRRSPVASTGRLTSLVPFRSRLQYAFNRSS